VEQDQKISTGDDLLDAMLAAGPLEQAEQVPGA
jgi:hypothetical protein